MSKNIKILALSLGLMTLIVALLIVFKKPTTSPDVNSTTPSTDTSQQMFTIPGPSDPQMTLHSKQGDINTNNIYQKKISDLSYNGVSFEDNPDYYISFYPQDQGFIIAIMNPNIQSARDAAENQFIKDLGISKEAACKLKVSLTVPFSVNENAAGGNYGLSFCPNGKPFPQGS